MNAAETIEVGSVWTRKLSGRDWLVREVFSDGRVLLEMCGGYHEKEIYEHRDCLEKFTHKPGLDCPPT